MELMTAGRVATSTEVAAEGRRRVLDEFTRVLGEWVAYAETLNAAGVTAGPSRLLGQSKGLLADLRGMQG